VRIRKILVRGETYHYLEHSARIGGRVVKKEIYLGRAVPDDIQRFEEELGERIYRTKWYHMLDATARRYSQEMKHVLKSSREKELDTFAVHFTYHSQRIEGSTLTLRETAELLERGLSLKDRLMQDVKEAEAHM
jgi:hypothetical protein